MKLSNIESLNKELRKIDEMGSNLKIIVRDINNANLLPNAITTIHADITNNISELHTYTQSLHTSLIGYNINTDEYDTIISNYIDISDVRMANVQCDINGNVSDIIDVINAEHGGDVSKYVSVYVNNMDATIDKLDDIKTPSINNTDSKNTVVLISILLSAIIILCKRLIKDMKLLTETRYPSIRLYNISIKPIISRIKGLVRKLKDVSIGDYNRQLGGLSSVLDAISIGVASYIIISEIYRHNKTKIQSLSYVEIVDYVNSNTCDGFDEYVQPEHTEPNKPMLNDVLNNIEIVYDVECDIQNSDITPSKPFLRKLEALDCDGVIDVVQDIPNKLDTVYGLENNAKIDGVVYKGVVGDKINPTDTIDGFVSPIYGVVSRIETNSLYLTDVSDGDIDITSHVDKLITLYKEQSDIEELVNRVYFYTLYPEMLSRAKKTNSLNIFTKKIDSSYSKALKEYKKERERFEKNIQQVCDANNIETHAKNETLDVITNDINNEKSTHVNNIKTLREQYIKNSSSYRRDDEDDNLSYYYIYDVLFNFIDLDSSISNKLRSIITRFISNRKGGDTFNNNKIGAYLKTKLLELTNNKISIKDIENAYKSNNDINSIYEIILANSNNSIESKRISYMFYVYKLPDNKEHVQFDLHKETTSESDILKDFWISLQNRNLQIAEEIKSVDKVIDIYSNVNYKYTMIDEDGISYRLYTDKVNSVCSNNDMPIESDFNPNTSCDFSNIKYWVKYMSMATLTGCIPIYWSVGLVILGVPIPLPIIYTPLKAINTQWGIIVIGLGVCGIAISPMVFYVNMENKLVSVVPNAAMVALKSSLSIAKGELAKKRKHLNDDILKTTNEELIAKSSAISVDIDSLIVENKKYALNTPTVPKLSVVDKPIYVPNLCDVSNINISITNGSYISNCDVLAKKNKLLYDDLLLKLATTHNTSDAHMLTKYYTDCIAVNKAYSDNLLKIGNLQDAKYDIDKDVYAIQSKMRGINMKSDIESIKTAESSISASERNIDTILKNIDKLYASVPIGILSPNSVNFGPSIKKYMLVTQIETSTDEKFDTKMLNGVISKYSIDNNVLATTNIDTETKKTKIRDCVKSIDSILGLLSIKDVLPKYEKLKPSNIKFMYFLSSTFCVDGAKHFGLPGYPQ